jgi:hypothetical protein
VLISDLPYHGTTECEDRTVRRAADASTPATATTSAAEEDAPWWMFWKFWD